MRSWSVSAMLRISSSSNAGTLPGSQKVGLGHNFGGRPRVSPVSRFDGKVAVITGGGAGIGRTYAHRFAAEGAAVVIADLDDAAAARVVDEVGASGGRALAHRMDVTDPPGAA